MTSSLRIALALLLFCIFGFAVSGQGIYARLSYLWLFIIVGNYGYSKLALRNISISRKARSLKGQVGEIFEETIEIINESRLPRIWIEVADQSRLPGSKGSRLLTTVGGLKTRTYVSRLRLSIRGAYTLGPTELRSGDPFGFFQVSRSFASKETLTIYPRIVNLYSFPSPPGLLPGGDSVRRRTHQITPNASTVREYVHGDPISRIHWPSTARRNRLIVKEFELDPLAEIWFFLDAHQAVHFSKPFDLDSDASNVMLGKKADNRLAPATEEYAASATASIARYFLAQDRSVALMISGRISDNLVPDRGARQLGKIMESLALMNADGTLSFPAFVSSQTRHLTRGSTVVLVTPSTDRQIAFTVDQIIRLGLRPIVILLDSLSFGGSKGSQELAEAIRAFGIPLMMVKEGEDLATSLRSAEHIQMPLHFFQSSSVT